MAKTKPSSHTVSPQEKVGTLIKKPETIVGAIVLGAVVIVASQAWGKDIQRLSTTAEATQQEVTLPAASPEPVVEPTPTPEPLSAIKVLAFTSSAQVVTVQPKDTFWKIARKYCGSGVQGYRIEQENGYTYKLLHTGDQIQVVCE